MIDYSIQQIAQACRGKIVGNPEFRISNIFIDSRLLMPYGQSLFFAIRGERHDGHRFITDLQTTGVRAFVVDQSFAIESVTRGCTFIIVKDVLDALQSFAAWHRQHYHLPIVGITGSNGKTLVKEWLFYLLNPVLTIARSPKSYNSQVGVPLSVALLGSEHRLAMFEAGISKPGEMARLQSIIKPSIGVLTSIGNAHQENFESLEQKISEKLLLFESCKTLVYNSDNSLITDILTKQNPYQKSVRWGTNSDAMVRVTSIQKSVANSLLTFIYKHKNYNIEIPFSDDASIVNACTCFATLVALGYNQPYITERFKTLPAVAMRLELKEGQRNCTIINDSYNSDLESFKIAIDFLNQQNQHQRRTVILSDMHELAMREEVLYQSIFSVCKTKKVDRLIGIGTLLSKHQALCECSAEFFASTEDFLKQFSLENFVNETILIKGARRYEFERIVRRLEQRIHQTVLEVNLTAMVHNLNYFKALLRPETKITAMVKAFSYGSGSYEIANLLQFHRVDYLAVAFADEGIELRNAGITMPIMVMNPEPNSFVQMIDNKLEPEIYSLRMLDLFTKSLASRPQLNNYPIHIKIDTGMARMGFSGADVPSLLDYLKQTKSIAVASVFSHLAGADEAVFDSFTEQQIAEYEVISLLICNALPYKVIRHILNSAGIERFASSQYDMVRLGIGLYGISALGEGRVRNISTLKTMISQIRMLEVGKTVGYSRKGKIMRASRIAVIPVGYADGLNRKFSNGVGEVLINGHRAPIIGNICMDATMIDITDIDAEEGDEVVLFGDNLSISELASKIETIPYELLTGISRRVKRIYFQE